MSLPKSEPHFATGVDGAWEILAASLLDEMALRLGSMRSAWLEAEMRRLHALLSLASDAALGVHMAGAIDMLHRLMHRESFHSDPEAAIVALAERVDSALALCQAATAPSEVQPSSTSAPAIERAVSNGRTEPRR